MKRLLAFSIVLACALALPARSEQNAQPPAGDQTAAPTSAAIPQPAAPAPIPAHPALYPSERQLDAWLRAGYSAFTTGEAHDDVFSIWGVSRWLWQPPDPILVGDDAALVSASCETPQLLATDTAWRGTRSALPEARITEAVYSELAQQAGYCRFLVVGLTKSPAKSLGLEYVLRVNGRRYGEPLVSGTYLGPSTAPTRSIDSRDYASFSVELIEWTNLDYKVEANGTTYSRTDVQIQYGYRKTVSAAIVPRPQPSQNRYLVSEIVDFPLVQDDGAPVIPADAHTITLEVLAPAASYEVDISLDADQSYLDDEPPMTNPMAAVTVSAGRTEPVPKITTASFPRTPAIIRLEELMKGEDFRDKRITVCQHDAAIPTVLASFGSEPKPSELRSLVRRMVEAGQGAMTSGELTIVVDIRGRPVLQGKYSAISKKVILTAQ